MHGIMQSKARLEKARKPATKQNVCICMMQVVDTEAFAKQDGSVDFDVNNLKFVQGIGLAIKNLKGIHPAGKDLDAILRNIREKRLLVLKPPAEVAHRIQNMQQRQWEIAYP